MPASEVNWAMVDAYAHSSDRSTRRAAEDFVLSAVDFEERQVE